MAVADVVQAWADQGLLTVFSPALTGTKVNTPGLARLQKAKALVPFGADLHLDDTALFLTVLTEKLSSRERSALAENAQMPKEIFDEWQKLDTRAAKLEKEIASSTLHRPSRIYHALAKAPVEQTLLLLVKSPQRVVQDRIRNYFQKYFPGAQEVTERDVVEAGGKAGTPGFEKIKAGLITKRLDARPKKVEPPPEPVLPAVPAGRPRASV